MVFLKTSFLRNPKFLFLILIFDSAKKTGQIALIKLFTQTKIKKLQYFATWKKSIIQQILIYTVSKNTYSLFFFKYD